MKTFTIVTAFLALTSVTTACELDGRALPCNIATTPDAGNDITARPPKVGDCDGGTSICDVPDSLN